MNSLTCWFCKREQEDVSCTTCHAYALYAPGGMVITQLLFQLNERHAVIQTVKVNHRQMNLYPHDIKSRIIVVDGDFMNTTPATIHNVVNRILALKTFL